jgi:hypothetical protein
MAAAAARRQLQRQRLLMTRERAAPPCAAAIRGTGLMEREKDPAHGTRQRPRSINRIVPALLATRSHRAGLVRRTVRQDDVAARATKKPRRCGQRGQGEGATRSPIIGYRMRLTPSLHRRAQPGRRGSTPLRPGRIARVMRDRVARLENNPRERCGRRRGDNVGQFCCASPTRYGVEEHH